MTLQNFNIVNPKSLEKQLKMVEGRIQELQTEVRELEKIKAACLILLGTPAEFPETNAPVLAETAAPKLGKKKAEKKSADAGEEASSKEESVDEFISEEANVVPSTELTQ